MKNILSISILVIAYILPSSSYAFAKNTCAPTKSTMNNYEPFTFEKTNNLLRNPGQEAIYCGEKILVSGRVLDKNCNPVSDAKIYAWQVNCQGKYPYTPLKNKIDENLIDPLNATTFTGNGTAVTNNLGEFHFITVYPKSSHDLLPHINFRVNHHRMGELQTRMILKGKKLVDPLFSQGLHKFSKIIREDNLSVYDFEIILP